MKLCFDTGKYTFVRIVLNLSFARLAVVIVIKFEFTNGLNMKDIKTEVFLIHCFQLTYDIIGSLLNCSDQFILSQSPVLLFSTC